MKLLKVTPVQSMTAFFSLFSCKSDSVQPKPYCIQPFIHIYILAKILMFLCKIVRLFLFNFSKTVHTCELVSNIPQNSIY